MQDTVHDVSFDIKGGIASRDRCESCEAGYSIQEASSTETTVAEHQAVIEAETRVEEGTATELKSQAEPVKKSLVVQQRLGTRLQ